MLVITLIREILLDLSTMNPDYEEIKMRLNSLEYYPECISLV